METSPLIVPLSAETLAWVATQVSQGGYQNATDFVRTLILQAQRDQDQDQAELEELLSEGMNGARQTATAPYWEHVRRQVWDAAAPDVNS